MLRTEDEAMLSYCPWRHLARKPAIIQGESRCIGSECMFWRVGAAEVPARVEGGISHRWPDGADSRECKAEDGWRPDPDTPKIEQEGDVYEFFVRDVPAVPAKGYCGNAGTPTGY